MDTNKDSSVGAVPGATPLPNGRPDKYVGFSTRSVQPFVAAARPDAPIAPAVVQPAPVTVVAAPEPVQVTEPEEREHTVTESTVQESAPIAAAPQEPAINQTVPGQESAEIEESEPTFADSYMPSASEPADTSTVSVAAPSEDLEDDDAFSIPISVNQQTVARQVATYPASEPSIPVSVEPAPAVANLEPAIQMPPVESITDAPRPLSRRKLPALHQCNHPPGQVLLPVPQWTTSGHIAHLQRN
jgi:hypothetical protein